MPRAAAKPARGPRHYVAELVAATASKEAARVAKACAQVADAAAGDQEVAALVAEGAAAALLAALGAVAHAEAAGAWEDVLDAVEGLVFCEAGRDAVVSVAGSPDPLAPLVALLGLGGDAVPWGAVARVMGNLSLAHAAAHRLVALGALQGLLQGLGEEGRDHEQLCWAVNLLCYHPAMLDAVGRLLEGAGGGVPREALTNLMAASLEPSPEEDGAEEEEEGEEEEEEEDEETEELDAIAPKRRKLDPGTAAPSAPAKEAPAAEDAPSGGPDWKDAAALFDRLILGGHLAPVALLHDPSGQGVGAMVELVERGVYAGKVCLLSCASEEEGLTALRGGVVAPAAAAMGMLMLAPHSRCVAKALLHSARHLQCITDGWEKTFEEPVQAFLEFALGKAQKPSKKSRLPVLQKALRAVVEAVPETAPHWADPATLSLRTEAGYALSSSRKGTEVFRKASEAGFGPVTVTRYGQWLCMRFGEVEQGLLYTGSPGCLGYDNGTPMHAVLGYDYIKTMAAACLAFAPAPLRRVGCVGLGSGALPYFLARHSKAAVVVWEVDRTVMEAAAAMGLPVGGGLTVEHTDALAGVQAVADGAKAKKGKKKAKGASERGLDAVLLDAYNEVGGIPSHLREPAFLAAVGAALAPGGVAVANLHNGPPGSADRAAAGEYIAAMCAHIGPCTIVKLPTQQSNLVAVAAKARFLAARPPADAAGLEFDANALLAQSYSYGVPPMDADGLPAGLWGVDAAPKQEA